jgi:hypothetical protein
MLKMKAANITPLPIILTNDFDSLFLPKPLIKKPSNGNNGTK